MPQYYDFNGNLVEGDINQALAERRRRWQEETRARQAAAWRRKALRTGVAGAAMFGGAYGLSQMFGSAGASAAGAGAGAASGAPAAAGAGWTMPGVTAPTFGAGVAAPAAAAGTGTAAIAPAAASVGPLATVGRMFSSPGAALLVNSGLSLLSNRSQTQAAERARLDLLEHNRQALALQLRQLEEESRNAALDREERIALNNEINRLRRMELEAQEEERAYRRTRED